MGGLPESIEDGRSGLLAATRRSCRSRPAAIVRDAGAARAAGRARPWSAPGDFTWEAAAERSLATLEARARGRRPSAGRCCARFAASDTGRAAGLASAVIATNVIALLFTIVFARVLGGDGYGSLAALMSAFIILMVPGSALQIAVAREVSRSVAAGDPHAGRGRAPMARRGWRWPPRWWPRPRSRCASPWPPLIAVDEVWAAAAVPVTSMLWMMLSVERGALQGFGRYRAVGWSLVGEGTAAPAVRRSSWWPRGST